MTSDCDFTLAAYSSTVKTSRSFCTAQTRAQTGPQSGRAPSVARSSSLVSGFPQITHFSACSRAMGNTKLAPFTG